jgi:hypothetical protein
MLTTGIKSGPSSGVLENGNGNGGNASAGSKGSTAGKPPGGISSSTKKVKNYKPETRSNYPNTAHTVISECCSLDQFSRYCSLNILLSLSVNVIQSELNT